MNHYIYKLTNIFPSTEQRYYIGVRTCECKPELDDYWSSSSYVKEVGSENFVKEVLSTWSTREEAVAEEIRLHELYDVARNPQYYNRAKQTSTGFDMCGNIESIEKMKRTKKENFTIEVSKRLSEAAKRRKPPSEETKKKISDNSPYKGKPVSEKLRQAIIECNRTRGVSDETKNKMSEAMKAKAPHYKITDPEGKVYIVEGGLKKFSERFRLNRNMLVRMSKGYQPTKHSFAYGWSCEIIQH